ncbi:MAG: hypothetical protein GY749_38160 [Desulfobacteraceae bacterium]|nr:hypothetical protein [Desulfobacteraceae bacterium]
MMAHYRNQLGLPGMSINWGSGQTEAWQQQKLVNG